MRLHEYRNWRLTVAVPTLIRVFLCFSHYIRLFNQQHRWTVLHFNSAWRKIAILYLGKIANAALLKYLVLSKFPEVKRNYLRNTAQNFAAAVCQHISQRERGKAVCKVLFSNIDTEAFTYWWFVLESYHIKYLGIWWPVNEFWKPENVSKIT